MIKLYWKDVHVGNVDQESGDQPGFQGRFVLVSEDPEIIEFLRATVDESRQDDIPEARADLWENWRLVDAAGNSEEIFAPAIRLEEKSIWWQPVLK